MIDTVVVQPATDPGEPSVSGVSWGAVTAGAVVSCALTLVLLAFGVGLGLSVVSPWAGAGVSTTTFKIGTGLYLIVIAMLSSSIGGYIAGRLRSRWIGVHTDEVYFRDTAHGFVAWALASVIGAISGILIVPITTLYYDTGFLIGLKGFIAAIIGGLVSYPLTAVAAIVVGIVEAFSSFYASNFKEVIVFTLILPVLVLRSLAAPQVEEEKD